MRPHCMAMDLKWIAAGALVLGLLGAESASARNGGIQSSATCSCHGNRSFTVTVSIDGPDALVVDQDASYTVEIIENVPGALQAGAGLNVVAFLNGLQNGSILGEDATNLQITQGGQLTHFFANPNSLGVFSYDFAVTAPSEPGTVVLLGAMNAFDGGGSTAGDNWNTTSLVVPVPEPGRHALGAVALLSVAALRRRRTC